MKVSIPEKSQISHFLVYFLIVGMQVGIGVLGYQKIIAKTAGYDAWISVILAGLSIHFIIWMMYKILETVEGDLVSVHSYLLGEKIGKIISFFFSFYFMMMAIAVLRTFIEVIQVWMFPDFSTFWFTLGFLLVTIYIIYGGFRTVTGIAFFGTVLPFYLIFSFFYTLPFSHFENLLPIWDHKVSEIIKASRDMSLTYLGYETFLFYYPYLKNPKKSKKWAHIAVSSTTLLYTVLAVVTFSYFSEKQLEKTIWPTLTMWKIVHLPFVERFEYIGIANWNLIILPNLCIAIWCASRILKRTIHIRQNKGVIIVAAICLLGVNIFETREQVNFLNDLTGRIGFYFNFLYVPFLFVVVFITKKVKKK
ncbi:GerAB/ArcD/ProY family transporter [Bacillus sp. CGMCC 1.16607]|uniref:GerAB/ArcD/ProY family transporter n=1 Tax=Bacillus sp. CGMCC 1.16607 TaxID=3351842 RepID=UPI0036318494